MFWQKIKLKLLLSVLGIIIVLSSLQVKSEEIILHVTVNKWGSGMMSISKISTYLVVVEKNKKFTVDGWRSFDNSFTFDKIQFDTLVKINFKRGMVIVGMPIKTDHYLKSLDIGLDTVSIRTPSCDAGTDYSFFIDTTELAKSIVTKNFKKIIEITDIDNPAEWVFNEEIYHPNGKLKLKWQEKHNERFRKVKHGLYEEWDISGNLIRRANFNYGNFDGEFLQFYPNGTLKLYGSYKKGKKDGEWKFFNNSGEVTSSGSYVNGTGDMFYPSGIQKTQENYDSINRTFSKKTWYLDGKLKYEETTNTNYKNVVKAWLQDGTEVIGNEKYAYRKDILELSPMNFLVLNNYNNNHDSLNTEYYSNNQLKQKAYFDETGNLLLIKKWFKNGQLSDEKKYKNGKLNGMSLSWDAEGNKQGERSFSSGHPIGTWKLWKPNGEILQTTEYINRDTAYTNIYHFDSEQVMMKGTVIFGVNEGKWEVYNDDGSLYSIIIYENGKQVTVNIIQ